MLKYWRGNDFVFFFIDYALFPSSRRLLRYGRKCLDSIKNLNKIRKRKILGKKMSEMRDFSKIKKV